MKNVQELVEKLAHQGVFGPGKFVGVTANSDAQLAPQFASSMFFFVIKLQAASSVEEIRVVVKIQPLDEAARELQNSNYQFFNEVTMFSEIMPFLEIDKLDVCPKFLYGVTTQGEDPDKDVVILEDLSFHGYVQPREQYLDSREVLKTLRKLGEFHGLSYRAKRTRKSEFAAHGGRLKAKRFAPDFDEIFNATLKRGIDAAAKRNPTATILDRTMEKIKNLGPQNCWASLSGPVEPFACIVHGDFNRNNLLFKYNAQGDVEGVKFIDFQMSVYSDPAVDISFFLYINTSQDCRLKYWDDFLAAYWEGVTAMEPNPGFSFEEFRKNFSKKALYGYFPCSFFLPMMLDVDGVDIPFEEFLSWSLEKRIQQMVTRAGEIGTAAIGDIVQHLLDKGYLDAFCSE